MKKTAPSSKVSITPMVSTKKIGYSDEELTEFNEIIQTKLDKAYEDLQHFLEEIRNENGTDDTSPTFKTIESGKDQTTQDENYRDIVRIKNFILVLELAKIRIIQKTYGICRVTGKLIPKDRLRSVPHATTSIEAKRQEGLLPKAKKTDTTTDFHSM